MLQCKRPLLAGGSPRKTWFGSGARRGLFSYPFDPGQLTGLQVWYRASDGLWQESTRATPATANADPVGAWDDLSGNNRHIIQATAGARPTLRTNVVNGQQIVRFDGSNDTLSVVSNLGMGSNIPFSLFIVFKTTTGSSDAGLFGTTTTAGPSGNVFLINHHAGTNVYFYIDDAQPNYSLGTSSFFIVGATWDGTTNTNGIAMYKDGTSQGNTTATLQPSAGTNGHIGQSTTFFNGDMAEIVLYNRVLSTAERQSVERYLGSRYAITVP